MNVKWVWTIPNVLSLARIALVPVFAALYLMSEETPSLLWWAIAALVVSGLTDAFDGLIARKCNQISEIGKILDPIADKLTQVTVVLCLAIRMPRLWPLLVICALKEILQSIGALVLLFIKKSEVQAARWYGKVCTVVFYLVMALYVLFPTMPSWLFVSLGVLVAATMLFAFFHYARLFLQIARRPAPENDAPAPDSTDASV